MAFILIGIGKETIQDLGESGREQQCVWCSTEVYYHLILVRSWLTYFSIPLFSYRSEYRIECPMCLSGIKIQGAEIEAAKRGELRLNSTYYETKR